MQRRKNHELDLLGIITSSIHFLNRLLSQNSCSLGHSIASTPRIRGHIRFHLQFIWEIAGLLLINPSNPHTKALGQPPGGSHRLRSCTCSCSLHLTSLGERSHERSNVFVLAHPRRIDAEAPGQGGSRDAVVHPTGATRHALNIQISRSAQDSDGRLQTSAQLASSGSFFFLHVIKENQYNNKKRSWGGFSDEWCN